DRSHVETASRGRDGLAGFRKRKGPISRSGPFFVADHCASQVGSGRYQATPLGAPRGHYQATPLSAPRGFVGVGSRRGRAAAPTLETIPCSNQACSPRSTSIATL